MSSPSTSPTQQQKHVRVGVGVLVKDLSSPDKIFCGIRKGSHGAGSLALPGGHLEMYESWEACARREVKEEMNLDLLNVKFAHVTNDPMETEGKHYVTIFMTAQCSPYKATPENMEPEKCEGWRSYSWSQLQKIRKDESPALFGPLARLVDEDPTPVRDFTSTV